jgi:hypothetical protein
MAVLEAILGVVVLTLVGGRLLYLAWSKLTGVS